MLSTMPKTAGLQFDEASVPVAGAAVMTIPSRAEVGVICVTFALALPDVGGHPMEVAGSLDFQRGLAAFVANPLCAGRPRCQSAIERYGCLRSYLRTNDRGLWEIGAELSTNSIGIVQVLIDSQGGVRARGKSGVSFVEVAQDRSEEIVPVLLEVSADVDKQDIAFSSCSRRGALYD
jgi:hypothetical protein